MIILIIKLYKNNNLKKKKQNINLLKHFHKTLKEELLKQKIFKKHKIKFKTNHLN